MQVPTLPAFAPTTLRLRSQPSRLANLKYHYCSVRQLRTEKGNFLVSRSNNIAPGELLVTALPKWVAVECAVAFIEPKNVELISRGWHTFGFTIPELASGQLNHKECQRCSSLVAASLSPASPEEDSTSDSSDELGPKIDLNLPRRRLQLSFTCDACGARSQRLINPDAYARGTIFVQCAGCEVYHKLVDNLGLIEEYDFRQDTYSKADAADLDVLE